MLETNVRRKRRLLRVPVSFWKLGNPDKSHLGFTTDVSATGVFITCNSPFPTQTDVAVMIHDPEEGFVLSGVVTRATKSHPSLQRVMKAGMGIAFHDEENPEAKKLHQMGHVTSLAAAGVPA